MRTTPLIGKKLWFAPRWWGGWGWSPISWEGAVVTAVFLVVVIAAPAIVHDAELAVATLTASAILAGIAFLKGTSPGTGNRREEFERGKRPLVHGGGDNSPHLADINRNWEHQHDPTGWHQNRRR